MLTNQGIDECNSKRGTLSKAADTGILLLGVNIRSPHPKRIDIEQPCGR
jgi:hypothetical protein